MSDYMRFKNAVIESTNRKVEDKIIKLMFNNWVCEDTDKKKPWKSIGVTNHWHSKLKVIMEGLDIEEGIPSSGVFGKSANAKLTGKNLHLFATEQNAIARSTHYK